MNPARKTLMVLSLLSLSRFAAAQSADATQLLKDVEARYALLQSYSDVGEVRMALSFGTDSSLPSAAAGQPSSFTIKLARPEMYKVTWEQKSSFFDASGAVRSDGDSRFLTMLGHTTSPENTEAALAAATGVSLGAAGAIPHLFFDLPGNTIASMENAVVAGEESIEGDDCYVVKAHSANFDRTAWISKTTRLIRQLRTDTSPDSKPPDITLTFADMKRALEATGQNASDEAVQATLDLMASGSKLQQTMGKQSSSMIEIHRQIQTDMPMSQADFR